jgi:hypothetical protein
MVVFTTAGSPVSLVDSNKKSLFDNDGVEWERFPDGDSNYPIKIAYRETRDYVSVIELTREEMKRVIKGPEEMKTPTTVLEMRYYAMSFHARLQRVVDEWPDQKLREILIKAEDTHKNAGDLLEKEAREQLEEEVPAEKPKESPPEATEAHRTPRTARSTPRPRKQEGSVSVALEKASVLLTPKQLEFMERLSECEEWEDQGVTAEFNASSYAEELSDTMNPMSVGAVITTLREKKLLTTEKKRIGAIKCCVFKLTDLGLQVYSKLAGGGKT